MIVLQKEEALSLIASLKSVTSLRYEMKKGNIRGAWNGQRLKNMLAILLGTANQRLRYPIFTYGLENPSFMARSMAELKIYWKPTIVNTLIGVVFPFM
jgi:hypothetical protein